MIFEENGDFRILQIMSRIRVQDYKGREGSDSRWAVYSSCIFTVCVWYSETVNSNAMKLDVLVCTTTGFSIGGRRISKATFHFGAAN